MELQRFLKGKGGRATSEQVLIRFDKDIKGEITQQLVRAMLKEIAEFKPLSKQWVLKPEFS